MRNYFQATKEYPHHLSIGAVLCNEKGEVAVHYFKNFNHPSIGEFDDFYILMRETPELGETIEETLKRGLKEEFGAIGNVVEYLGPIVAKFSMGDVVIEKTTLYFLCDLISIDESTRTKDDPESSSEIRFLLPEELIVAMREQRQRIQREDADESAILERLIDKGNLYSQI